MKGEHVQIEWSDLEVERCGSPRWQHAQVMTGGTGLVRHALIKAHPIRAGVDWWCTVAGCRDDQIAISGSGTHVSTLNTVVRARNLPPLWWLKKPAFPFNNPASSKKNPLVTLRTLGESYYSPQLEPIQHLLHHAGSVRLLLLDGPVPFCFMAKLLRWRPPSANSRPRHSRRQTIRPWRSAGAELVTRSCRKHEFGAYYLKNQYLQKWLRDGGMSLVRDNHRRST